MSFCHISAFLSSPSFRGKDEGPGDHETWWLQEDEMKLRWWMQRSLLQWRSRIMVLDSAISSTPHWDANSARSARCNAVLCLFFCSIHYLLYTPSAVSTLSTHYLLTGCGCCTPCPSIPSRRGRGSSPAASRSSPGPPHPPADSRYYRYRYLVI